MLLEETYVEEGSCVRTIKAIYKRDKVVIVDSWAQKAMEVDGRQLIDLWSFKGL